MDKLNKTIEVFIMDDDVLKEPKAITQARDLQASLAIFLSCGICKSFLG